MVRKAAASAGLWLALTAVLLHLIVPAGWMPSAELSAPIVMCTPDGPMQMPAEEGVPDSPSGKHHDTCPYGAAPHVAALAPLPAMGVPLASLLALVPLPQAMPRTLARAYVPQNPRGPPAQG